jgi:hypothetical protein
VASSNRGKGWGSGLRFYATISSKVEFAAPS